MLDKAQSKDTINQQKISLGLHKVMNIQVSKEKKAMMEDCDSEEMIDFSLTTLWNLLHHNQDVLVFTQILVLLHSATLVKIFSLKKYK